jgi:hypothetical protein
VSFRLETSQRHVPSVYDLLLIRVRATGTSDRRRSGRPRETTLRQDRHITLIHLRNRVITTVDTARRNYGIRNNRISDQTVEISQPHVPSHFGVSELRMIS